MSASYDLKCPVARTLDIIGERWTILILRDLVVQGPRKFQDFLVSLSGISPNTLSARLKTLEDSGIIERRFSEDHPPRAEYVLTEKGRELRPVLRTLRDWGQKHTSAPASRSPTSLGSSGFLSGRNLRSLGCAVLDLGLEARERFRSVDVREGGLAADRHLDHRLAIAADQTARADIALDRHQVGEEAARPQHRVAALAVHRRHHRKRALFRIEGADQAV